MYISAKKIVDVWTQQGGSIDDLGSYLLSTQTLLKKYGSTLMTEKVLSVVEKYDSSLSGFISLLNNIGKCSLKDIATILGLTGKTDDGLRSIHSSHPDRVGILKDGVVVEKQEAVGLTVQGSGKIYKRSLNHDMGKLLS